MFTCIWIDEAGEQHSTFHETQIDAEIMCETDNVDVLIVDTMTGDFDHYGAI